MKKVALAVMLSGALLAGSAVAHQAGDVVVRAGVVRVNENSESTTKTPIQVDLKVKNNQQLGLTATYMFTDNVAVELLGATPFSHKINANVPALGAASGLGRVAIVKQLPPSLYAQYYFFNAKSTHAAVTNLEVKKNSFAPVANLGVDVKLTDKLSFNAAAWYTRIKTTAKFDALGAKHEVKLKLDPVVLFAGFGINF